MSQFSLLPTEIAQWHALINEAQAQCNHQLALELESYLVFLLMRFVDRPELAKSVVAIDFLEGLQKSGQQRISTLRDVGDKCLLFSGLFPGIATRRALDVGYFIEIGRSAFDAIASHDNDALFGQLSNEFHMVVSVLSAVRLQQTVDAVLQKQIGSHACDPGQTPVSFSSVNQKH